MKLNTTLCWHCSQLYQIDADVCPHCGSGNANKFYGAKVIETKQYNDGTVATGPAPLPAQSPCYFTPCDPTKCGCKEYAVRPAPTPPRVTLTAQDSEVLALAEEYGEWMWDSGYMDTPRGEVLATEAEWKRKAIRDALETALLNAYADGRADEREQCAKECREIADGLAKEGEGCRDGRYEWMGVGALDCFNALGPKRQDAA